MKPADEIHVETFEFEDDGSIPNSRLPVVLYRQVTPGDGAETAFRTALKKHGWGGNWVNGVYDYHHYHSTAHEFLGVLSGTVHLQRGGEQGARLSLHAGDAVVLPAGTGHKCEGNSDNFKILGAYPDGQDWDLGTGKKSERPKVLENIGALPRPKQDPLYGTSGPLKELWS